MRIHAVPALPRNHVIIVENAQVVDECALDVLVWVAGDDTFVELLMHPDEVRGFIAKFYPTATSGRLN